MKLNEAGFITNYMISGPVERPFIDHTSDDNQLHYEKFLRSKTADKNIPYPDECITLGKKSRLGTPWKYYYSYGNWFVDCSTFYSTLQKIALDGATVLFAPADCQVRAVLWSYAAIDVWCNSKKVCTIANPVYKPITKAEMTISLHKGENLLYIALQNLGVRDTRNLFGIQILDQNTDIEVLLPDMAGARPFIECESWLSAVCLSGRKVVFPSVAPDGTKIGYDSKSPDYADVSTRVVQQDVSGKTTFTAETGKPYLILSCSCGSKTLSRKFEIVEEVKPVYTNISDFHQNTQAIYARIAAVDSLNRGDKFGFAIPNILARSFLGIKKDSDCENFYITLQQIEDRFDCSDFLISGLIRYLKNYSVDSELQKRIDEVLFNYRYWMNMEGSDAMCFWSENHSLLFYSNAMFVGQMYPDGYFLRAKMTGKELYAFGKKLTEEWLDDVEKCGFEEFLSTVYMCVTFACLLNIIDYAESAISKRATKVVDAMLRMLAAHTFKGSIIAPMGRVYREIVYPFAQAAQSLMNLINPKVPHAYGEGWLSFYATSSYRFPDDLVALMEDDRNVKYATGAALIHLEKNDNWCLTSVQSPRTDKEFKRWQNETLLPNADKSTHLYTKSINERFHGTTCFEPGVYGYQQHMWTAALSNEAIVFANHPGGTFDGSSMRPGYWYGNGVMPAVKQEKNTLGAIYCIPDNHPIHFIHAYLPAKKFDEVLKMGNWLFARRGKSFIGLWGSTEAVIHNDQLFDCEYRFYSSKTALLCLMGSEADSGDFTNFYKTCKIKSPSFDEKTDKLITQDGFSLIFAKHEDKTQYV